MMEKLWDHCFLNELKFDPSGMRVLLTEKPKNPRKNREMMAELMFEYFKVDNLYIALQFVLALTSSGRTSGISCDIGESTTCVAPIVEGYPIQEAVSKVNIGGINITEQFSRMLHEDNEIFSNLDQYYQGLIARNLKNKYAFSSLDIQEDYKKAQRQKKHHL